jgi:hypothetical protein
MTSLTHASAIRTPSSFRREGLLTRMIRLWVEHNQRMAEFGLSPF